MNPTQTARRVALFGGSFDPPHLGHLAVAQAAREALQLDEVLFAPVGAQPLKASGASAGFVDRLAMTQLAIEGQPGFAVSLIDAPRPGGAPNYTLNTLERFRMELGKNCELFFLMGADSLASLRQWHQAAEVPFAAEMIVASRPGVPLSELTALLPSGLRLTPGLYQSPPGGIELARYVIEDETGKRNSLYVLPGLALEISASAIRESRHAGDAGTRWAAVLPEKVADYVREHGLYR